MASPREQARPNAGSRSGNRVESNMIDQTLHRLRKDFEAVQSAARDVHGPSRASLAAALRSLRGSLQDLASDSAPPTPPEAETSPARTTRRLRRMRLRSFAARSTMLVRMMGTGTSCRWVNRAWLAHTGRSLAQTTETGWLQDIHPEDRQDCVQAGTNLDSAHVFRPLEYRLRGADGDYAWVLELRTPRLASDGHVTGYLCAALDIGQQREAAAGLALQASIARELTHSGSGGQAVVPILRLVCEHLSWDEAELTSADAVPCSLARWPAATSSDGSRTPSEAENGAAEDLGRRSSELRVPVELHGRSWGSLNVRCRTEVSRGRAADDALQAAAAQLGQCLEHEWLARRLRHPEQSGVDLLDSMSDALIAIDRSGCVLDSNFAAQRRFGHTRAAVVGAHIRDIGLPAPILARVVPLLVTETAWASAVPRESGPVADGERMRPSSQPDGAQDPSPPLSIYVCELGDLGQVGAIDLVYQSRLKAMTSELLLAEENERRQLAADLHDGLGQILALVALKLTSLRGAAAPGLAPLLLEVEELVAEADSTARSIGFELSPPILHDLGLEPAVQWLAENIEERYGIRIDLRLDGRPKPTDERTRVLLYRSIRELLINAAKHSGVKRVRVVLEREGGHLCAEVSDEGVGMDSRALHESGFGLLSMSERLQHLGGTMRVFSAPGLGMRVRLRAPIAEDTNEKGEDR